MLYDSLTDEKQVKKFQEKYQKARAKVAKNWGKEVQEEEDQM